MRLNSPKCCNDNQPILLQFLGENNERFLAIGIKRGSDDQQHQQRGQEVVGESICIGVGRGYFPIGQAGFW